MPDETGRAALREEREEGGGRTNARYARDLARAFGGAVIFAVPLLMTMEMWFLGFYMDRLRLFLLVALNLALLLGLANFTGFEKSATWRDDAMDALSAVAIGALASCVMLALFGVVTSAMTADEIVGKIALQTVPASIGAMLARRQLGEKRDANEDRKERAGYAGQVFLMTVGALFVAFNVAPTDEMALIALQITPWHAMALVVVSIVALDAFVYGVGFAGQESPIKDAHYVRTFVYFTVAGYGVALMVSLYVLWTFGRTDGASLSQIVHMTVVLGFPATIGAATARLIV